MAEAALKIILVDEGGAGTAATQPPPQTPAPDVTPSTAPPAPTGPPPTPAGGPVSTPATSPADTQPINVGDTRVITPQPATTGPDAEPKQQPSPRGKKEPTKPEPDLKTAATTFAETLAKHSGLGQLVGSIRVMVGVLRDFARLVAAAQRHGGPSRDTGRVSPPQQTQPAPQTPAPQPPAPASTPTGPPPVPTAGAAAPVEATALGPAPPVVASGASAAGSAAGAGATQGAAAGAQAAGAGLAAAAGPAVIALAAVATAAVAAGLAIKVFSSIIKDQAQKLEGYSAPVAQATSESEIRQERAMFRRAEKIGPDVAKFERLRGQASEKLTDIVTTILGEMMEFVGKFEPQIKFMIEVLEVIPPGIEVMSELLQAVLEGVTLRIPSAIASGYEAQEAAGRMLKEIRDLARDEAEEDDPLEDPFLDSFDKILSDRMDADRRRARG